ncbi:MAG: isoamylase early set domain-containing protein [Gemmatimonadaceae bacterium]|nr:isoamylase early set domain-containing protein [Gemmatimonadaceae bacterium]
MDDAAVLPGEALEQALGVLRATTPVTSAGAAAIAAQARLAAGRTEVGAVPRAARWVARGALAAAALLVVALGVRVARHATPRDAAPTVATVPVQEADARDAGAGDARASTAPELPLVPALLHERERASARPVIARSVRLLLEAPDARRVQVAGDFNDWSRDETPLVRDPATGRWTVVLQLPPGRYKYAFLVNGRRWVADTAHERVRDDDFGVPTSELVVEARP